MLIRHVELTNVKSYSDQTIEFTPGVNAVCGLNGAGKSTILEAIGFVLFDFLPYSQADFIREGEKTATVTVRFISGRDGRVYDVTRRIGKNAAYFVTDPGLNLRLAEQKQDVSDWLRDHLGISATAEIADVYQNAIGVPQGLLTAAFLETPARRKVVFDPLLQVDEYDKAWERLRDVERHQKDQIAALNVQLAQLEGKAQRAADLQAKLQTLTGLAEGLDQDRDAAEVELGLARDSVQGLEADKWSHDKLTTEIGHVEQQFQYLDEDEQRMEGELEKATGVKAVLAKTGSGYQAYLDAQKRLEATPETEEWEAEIKRLNREREELRGSYSKLSAEAEKLQEQIEELKMQPSDQGACPLCGQALPSDANLLDHLVQLLYEKCPEVKELADTGREMSNAIKELEERFAANFQAAREGMDTHRSDHDEFVRNSHLAERYDEIEDGYALCGVKLLACAHKKDALYDERDTLHFDASAYNKAHQQERELERKAADLKGRISAVETQLDDLTAEVYHLANAEADLRTCKTQHKNLGQALEATAMIRDTIKKAGPYATRRLVDLIGQEADCIFADIVQDSAMTLGWDTSYEISIAHDGNHRSFKQLSGGEQMAAALAVRLALLKEMSAVDVAFFDEPTGNLDAQRRELLAEQLLRIKGFSQLFVISHDDTFERAAESMIRVEKENGTSRVVA